MEELIILKSGQGKLLVFHSRVTFSRTIKEIYSGFIDNHVYHQKSLLVMSLEAGDNIFG